MMIEQTVAIDRLRLTMALVEAFEPTSILQRTDPQITALEAAIEEALILAFGDQTPAYKHYEQAALLDTASYRLNGTPHDDVIAGLIAGKVRALALLNQAIGSLRKQHESAA